MQRLIVHYSGWGEDWPLGRLADDGSNLLFEYAPEALAQGLELSPLSLKLRAPAYGGFPAHLHRLPGLVADSLPDGWGLLLMDRLFRRQGVRHPSPLDRLAFIGDRAMGALRFVPAREADADEPDWNLLVLAEESARALSGEAGAALRELAVTGGSPQGARPKALVQYEVATGQVSTLANAPGQPWLVKFPAQGEHRRSVPLSSSMPNWRGIVDWRYRTAPGSTCHPGWPPSAWRDSTANRGCASRYIVWPGCCRRTSVCREPRTTPRSCVPRAF
jgi:serine/threonine-protein kinase HipA